MKKKLEYMILFVMLFNVTLCGCRGNNQEKDSMDSLNQNDLSESVNYGDKYRESETVNTLLGNWLCDEEIKNSETFMLLSQYEHNLYEAHDEYDHQFWRGSFVDENNIYSMKNCYGEQNGKNVSYFFLDILNAETMDIQTVQYETTEFLGDITVSKGKIITFIQHHNEDGYVEECKIVELLKDGSIKDIADIYDVFDRAGLIPREPYYAIQADIKYDSASGKIYLFTPDYTKLYIIDEKSKETVCFEGFDKKPHSFEFLCNSYEGIPLFVYSNDEGKKVFWFSDNEPIILCETTASLGGDNYCMDEKGNILYKKADSIVCWNPKTGCRERLLTGANNSLSFINGILRNEKGEIIVVSVEENELRKYTYGGPSQSVTITVDSLIYYGIDKQAFNEYEVTHPGVKFDYGPVMVEGDDKKSKESRLFADLSKGEGPDIIIGYEDDFIKFAEKGCLLELNDVFSEETKELFLPQIMDLGKVNQNQYAVFLDFRSDLVMVHKDTWKEDTWTLNEIIELIDKRKKEGRPFEYLFVDNYGWVYYPPDILLRDIYGCGLVDFKDATCCFDSEEFIRLLEICKEYYVNTYSPDSFSIEKVKIPKLVEEGKILAIVGYAGGFDCFSEIMALQEEKMKAVGYPTNSKTGNILTGGYCLFVNRNTQNYEIIKDFVNNLYSYDYMEFSISSVPYSKDIYDNRIRTRKTPGNEWMTFPLLDTGSHTAIALQGKANGDSFLNEYKEFLDSLRPYEWNTKAITSIIYEEAIAYFNSDTISSEETAEKIQSRVQLYLWENK